MGTQIDKRQIKDGAIDDSKVGAGAGIQTSKLADGANLLLKDGSVALTGNLQVGNNRVTGVAAGQNATDAVNKSQMDAAVAARDGIFKPKTSVRAASVANVTISNPATATFDGVTLQSGDRLLLKNQTAPAENGIYVFNGSSSAMTRATDFDAWNEIPAAFLAVEEGSVNDNSIWLCTNNQGGTLGTTAITFIPIPTTAGLMNSNFVDKEVPSGAINGSNVTFVLANTPAANSEHIYLNGLLQQAGAGNDYTISGQTITMNVAPLSGEKILVSYRK